MASQFYDALHARKSAVTGAVNQGRKLLGVSTNADIRVYNKLTEADFADLAVKFGPEATMDYIKTMEAKRLQEGQDG